MNTMDVEPLRSLAVREYPDIVRATSVAHKNDLRLFLADGSFIKVWFSLRVAGRYSYHWERRTIDGTIYRHDNAPDREWKSVSTWPKHFHAGSQESVIESHLDDDPLIALRQFLTFVRGIFNTKQQGNS
ncbi:MAG: hypothetical protein KBG20_10485 [Caldilineaceae bacterium]|nr:hypothetical protein [Caldilineaceae bacterium]MBP8106399.1 hypothetical protein [Caldilineaceae bacterium]MBP8121418.1 hypothetical protein [Caldilineaceae bacterium]MBP9072720.1 hypothetical protein [Caldilineaceae bacterium]